MNKPNLRIPSIVNVETAIKIYYNNCDLGNKEIKELFGIKSSAKQSYLKRIAMDLIIDEDIPVFNRRRVNTDAAFRAWGLNIQDLEKRYMKIVKLGLDERSYEK